MILDNSLYEGRMSNGKKSIILEGLPNHVFKNKGSVVELHCYRSKHSEKYEELLQVTSGQFSFEIRESTFHGEQGYALDGAFEMTNSPFSNNEFTKYQGNIEIHVKTC